MIHPVMGALGKRGKARIVHCLKRCVIMMGEQGDGDEIMRFSMIGFMILVLLCQDYLA
jgi:hypothetical protein